MAATTSDDEEVFAVEQIIRLLADDLSAADLNDIGPDDWERMAVTAVVLGLAPMLHWRLERLNFSPPPMAMAKLAVTRKAQARRNDAIAQQLTEILRACSKQKISAIVLKGAVLAPLAYPEAALRPMNDIDLLFRPDDLPAVEALLAGLGYQAKYKADSLGPGITKHLRTFRRQGNEGATPNPYLSAAGDRTVEPHGSLEESWFGLKVDISPGVWERAVPVSLHGQPAHRLSTGDMVPHLSIHAAFHVIMGTSVFLQLYDIGQVVDRWSDELNWAEVLSLTTKVRAQPFVYASLYWAKRLFNAAIPESVLHTLQAQCPPSLVAYVQASNGSSLFKRTQRPPLVTFSQRLKRGLLDRQEAARWASSLGEKWKIWQTALAFYKTDTAGLLVGRGLKVEL